MLEVFVLRRPLNLFFERVRGYRSWTDVSAL